MTTKIKRAFLDTEDGQILYKIGGQGDPILFLHQNTRSSDEYRELMSLFALDNTVIAMDMIGLGDSDKPPRMYTIQDYAKTVIALLDELGIEKINLLGNHTGAFIAGEVAASYSKRVNQLILSNPTVFEEEGLSKLFNKFNEAFKIKEDGSHLIQRWNSRSSFVESPELNHRWVLDDFKCSGYPAYAVSAVVNYALQADARFQLIKCPTLIIWGIKDLEQIDKLGLAKMENRKNVSQAIPHSKSVEITEGTICMMNQIPEKIAEVVKKFLKQN